MAQSGKVFQNILREAADRNIQPAKTEQARGWFRERAREIPDVSVNDLLDDLSHRLVSDVSVGSMYLYKYDPKLKKELPYYDTHPLVIPCDYKRDGFQGLNMHYLPPQLRGMLMDNLYKVLTNYELNDTTRMAVNYTILKGTAKFRTFKPCYKRYLYSHIESKFLYIDPKEWDIALFLPLANWVKRDEQEVWADSYDRINM